MNENSIDAVTRGRGDPERSEDEIRSQSLGQRGSATSFPFTASPSRRVSGSVLTVSYTHLTLPTKRIV